MKGLSTLIVAAMCVAVAGGCGKKPKGELDRTRTGGTGSESTGGETGEGGTGDRGAVSSELANRLKPIYFDFDKANIREDARATLENNAAVLRDNADVRIVIQGHCDERGTDEYNLALGERRAKATLDYLVRMGVDRDRITVISYGEERPASSGHDEAAWQLNRRGEFVPK